MKLKILLTAVFVAGLAASFALASPSDRGHGADASTSTSASTGTTGSDQDSHGKKKLRGHSLGKEHGAKSGCRNVQLKGTLADATLTLAVSKASAAGHSLVGGSVSLAASGHASIVARICGATGSQTYELRKLVIQRTLPKGEQETTTSTATTTSTTTAATTGTTTTTSH